MRVGRVVVREGERVVDPPTPDLAWTHQAPEGWNPRTPRPEGSSPPVARRHGVPPGVVQIAVLHNPVAGLLAQAPRAPLLARAPIDDNDLGVAAGSRLGVPRKGHSDRSASTNG